MKPFNIIKGSFQFCIHLFFAIMTYMALSEENPSRRNFLRKARSHKMQLVLCGDDCPNSTPLVEVLLAAKEIYLSSTEDLCKYQAVVDVSAQACAAEAGLVQHEALLYERAGFVYARRNDATMAGGTPIEH